MRLTPKTRQLLMTACLAAAVHAECGAQDVVFVDDLVAARAKSGYTGAPAASLTAQQAAYQQGANARLQAQLQEAQLQAQLSNGAQAPAPTNRQSGGALGRLTAGIKGIFTRDTSPDSTPPSAASGQPGGVVQAGYNDAAARPGSPRPNTYRAASGSGLNLRQGDQRQGLFETLLGKSSSTPSSAAEAAQQARARSNTLQPTALANAGRVQQASQESGSPLKARARSNSSSASSSGPLSLPSMGAPASSVAQTRAPAPLGQAAPPRNESLPSAAQAAPKPSDGVVMITDMPTEPAAPLALPATDDEPLFITDMPNAQPSQTQAAPAEALAASGPAKPLPPAASAAPRPLIVENPNARLDNGPLPVVTTPAQVSPLPAVTPEPVQVAESAPGSVIDNTQPYPEAKGPQGKKPVVAVLPNPVDVSDSKPTEPSPRAAALLAEAHYLARDAQTEEDYSRVVQQCRHVLAIDESTVAVQYSNELAAWALNKRGELKADQGLDAEAVVDFDEAVQKDAGQWRAIHNRGVMQAQAGRYAEAFEAFNKTIELNPKFAKAYSNRASLYVQSGDFEVALDDYKRAIALDPDLVIAHKGRGRVCHVLGQLEQALRHFEAAAHLAPDDASIASCRADLLVDMGRYPQAANGYRTAIELDPNDPIAYRNLAWMQATCPDPSYLDGQRALGNAVRAIELGGEDDICLDTLAAAQAASGDFSAAVATIKQAIALAPASDQGEYAQRLALYQESKPFRTQPAGVRQVGYAQDGDK